MHAGRAVALAVRPVASVRATTRIACGQGLCANDSLSSLCSILRPGLFASHFASFRLFEVRSAFCPRSLLVNFFSPAQGEIRRESGAI